MAHVALQRESVKLPDSLNEENVPANPRNRERIYLQKAVRRAQSLYMTDTMQRDEQDWRALIDG